MKKIIRTIVPHYFFKEPIQEITNPELQTAIDQVKQAPFLDEAIRETLEILRKRYRSMRFLTYILFFRWFETDPNKLWNRPGYIHCTHLNYLFRVLMIESGWLKEEDIQLGRSLVWHVSPHQYLKIQVSNHWVAIDPWHYNLERVIGKYASGFILKTLQQ